MNNYKITIQYDGTRYKGWQGQNSTGLTIQGKIEAVLGQMAGHAVEVIGSGRTRMLWNCWNRIAKSGG